MRNNQEQRENYAVSQPTWTSSSKNFLHLATEYEGGAKTQQLSLVDAKNRTLSQVSQTSFIRGDKLGCFRNCSGETLGSLSVDRVVPVSIIRSASLPHLENPIGLMDSGVSSRFVNPPPLLELVNSSPRCPGAIANGLLNNDFKRGDCTTSLGSNLQATEPFQLLKGSSSSSSCSHESKATTPLAMKVQMTQTRNVRFDQRSPQTVELRPYSSEPTGGSSNERIYRKLANKGVNE